MYLSERHRIFRLSSRVITGLVVLALGLTILSPSIQAQDKSAPNTIDVTQKLAGFDAFMEKTLKDWNAPGIGVGIVINDKLVFAKGYGFRDYEKKLPITANTLFPIASNTKLFTAVAAGFLVEEGKLFSRRLHRSGNQTDYVCISDSNLRNLCNLRMS